MSSAHSKTRTARSNAILALFAHSQKRLEQIIYKIRRVSVSTSDAQKDLLKICKVEHRAKKTKRVSMNAGAEDACNAHTLYTLHLEVMPAPFAEQITTLRMRALRPRC